MSGLGLEVSGEASYRALLNSSLRIRFFSAFRMTLSEGYWAQQFLSSENRLSTLLIYRKQQR